MDWPALPLEDEQSAPFWKGAREGRLLLQRCASCRRWRYPPAPICAACGSFDSAWEPASGVGTVYSWTIAHHAFHPGLADRVPYNIVLVELEEGPRMVSNLVDVEPDAIRDRLRVSVCFREVAPNVVLPQFRPAE
jgi:uncharacterized OB-fold protein